VLPLVHGLQKEGLPGIDTAELQNILAMVATSRLPKKEQAANGNAETAAGAAAADAASSGTIPPALSPEAMPAAWKALASVAGKVVDDVFHPVAYIENEETDTQVSKGPAAVWSSCTYVEHHMHLNHVHVCRRLQGNDVRTRHFYVFASPMHQDEGDPLLLLLHAIPLAC